MLIVCRFRSVWTVCFVACIGLSSAQAQDRLYAERGGDDDPANNCQDAAYPCTFNRALSQVADNETIAVRVAAAGSTTGLGGSQNLTLNAESIYLAAYESIAPETNVRGTLAIEGDVSIIDGQVFIDDKLTLEVLSDNVTLRGVISAPSFEGSLVLGSRGDDVTIKLTGSCASLEGVTVKGDVTVVGSCNTDVTSLTWLTGTPFEADPGLGITGSLRVMAGSLKLDDRLALHIVAVTGGVSDTATVEIASGASIEGNGYLQLASEEEIKPGTGPATSRGHDCILVVGDGQLQVPFTKSTESTVCLDVAELKGSSVSANLSGDLLVRNATSLQGDFRNEGTARTEFWKLTEMNGDLEVLGSEDFREADGLRCTLDEYPGVHLFKGTTIAGSVEVSDVKTVGVELDKCFSGLFLRGVANPADPEPETIGIKEGTDFTTVKGAFHGKVQALQATSAGARVYMGSHNFYHNLALESDVITTYAASAFEMADAAVVPGARGYLIEGGHLLELTKGEGMDYCNATIGSAVGNMVILKGEGAQQIEMPVEYGEQLEIGALRVNKPGGMVKLFGAAGLRVGLLELEAGTVVTGTAADDGLLHLSELVLNHNTGPRGTAALAKAPGQESLYIPNGQPITVVYKGNASQVIGNEVARPAGSGSLLTRLAIAKSGDAVVELMHPLAIDWQLDLVSGKLVLHRVDDDAGTGWLTRESENATLSFTGHAFYIEVNNGDIAYPEDRAMHGSMAALHKNVAYTPTLKYVGASDRTTGEIWPSYPTEQEAVLAAPVYSGVQVTSSCTQGGTVAHPIISLGLGYTAVYGNSEFQVINGAFDLAGQDLSMFSVRSRQEQRIVIHEGGQLCDSAAGQSCARRKGTRLAAAPAVNDTQVFEQVVGDKPRELSQERLPVPVQFETIDTDETEARRVQSAHVVSERNPRVEVKKPDDRLALAAELKSAIDEKNLQLPKARKSDNESGWISLYSGPLGGAHSLEVWFSDGDLVATLPQVFTRSVRLTLDGSITTFPSSPGAMDRLSTLVMPRFVISRGIVSFKSRLDRFHVTGDFTMISGRAHVLRPVRPSGIPRMEMIADGVWLQVGGSFDLNCNTLDVGGTFWLDRLRNEDGSLRGADAAFHVGQEGLHRANGGLFHVGPDSSAARPNLYSLGTPCDVSHSSHTQIPDDAPVGLHVAGDYRFFGTGDVSDSSEEPDDMQGLRGMVTFAGGGEEQLIAQAEKADAQFGDVTIATTIEEVSRVVMTGNVTQNATGTLTMKRGQIVTNDIDYTWTLLNPAAETIPKGRNTPEGGSVKGGSRQSYFVGASVVRAVTGGQATGGVVLSGYFFPTGFPKLNEIASRDVDLFRPLTMQFPDQIAANRASVQMASYPSGFFTWPEENLVVADTGGTMLELNEVSDVFWRVRFDERPVQDPNIRVAVEGLRNVRRLTGLRLVQWDCDGQNPRLAGTYDLWMDPVDDASIKANDWINGVPNVSQEGVDFDTCSIVGIAADYNENPISLPAQASGFSRVQLINNVVGSSLIDVYVDDRKVAEDWGFQQATKYLPVPAGSRTLAIADAQSADQTAPLFSMSVELSAREDYSVMIYGDQSNLGAAVKEKTRIAANEQNMIDFFMLHGAPDLGPVDIRLLDPRDNRTITMLLANNLDFGDAGYYVSLSAGRYNLEITTANNDRQLAVYRLNLDQYRGAALVLNLTGAGKSVAEGLTVMGINARGNTFYPQVITDTEPVAELPTELTLQGNYPNPFNPSTTIALDLPKDAEVTVQVTDMLGRQVLEFSAGNVEAGVGRTLMLDAGHLASGAYLYRVIAKSVSDIMIGSGRMVLMR